MNLFEKLKKFINRIDEVDRKAQKLSKEKSYSSNPFAFQQNRTYVWVERVKKFDKCGRFRPRNDVNSHNRD